MSIQIPITPRDYKELKKLLLSGKEVVCLNERAYIMTLLVGRELMMQGRDMSVNQIKKAY